MTEKPKKEENKKVDEKRIHSVYNQFIRNIESVEVFFENFETKAREEDNSIIESRKKYLENAILKTFGQKGLDDFKEEVEKRNIEEVKSENKTSKLIKEPIPGEKMEDFLYQIIKSPKIQDKNFEILTSGVFLILNNHFEYLFADLLTYHFVSNKKTLEEKNVSISLNELKNYSTIEEAYNDILFREVEKILLDLSFDEIKNYFKKLDVSLSEKLIDWELINEIRERRHLIVHNNSIVNKKYLTRSNNPFNYEIGETLGVSSEYFKKAITEIKLAGIVLTMNCWGKWSKENVTEAIGELMDLTFELLKENRTELAIKICEYINSNIKPRNDDEEAYVLRAKVNYCIALKRLKKDKLLSTQLESIRTSSLTPIFKIAKHLLKDEFNETIQYIKHSILVDELSIEDFYSWPLFENIRKDEKYLKLIIEEFK